MKKILIYGIGFLLLFVVLVGVTFAILVKNVPDEEQLIVEYSAVDEVVESKALKLKQAEVDTLQQQLFDVNAQLAINQVYADSLLEQVTFKDGLIDGYTREIDGLNETVLAFEKQSTSMKELAKTFESMKSTEMKPILHNVDDSTILSIYKNMSAKNRKVLFMALEQSRAARITEVLAGNS